MESEKRLSSMLVPIYKTIPLLVLGVAIYGIIRDGRYDISGIIFVLLWCGAWYFFGRRWKSVRLKGSSLLVSNYFSRAEIPIGEIASIEASPWWSWQPQTVKIYFKSFTPFGDEIVFVPAGGWFWAESWAESLRDELEIEE